MGLYQHVCSDNRLGVAIGNRRLSVMSWERTGISFPRWLTGLGDISYSIYMWHVACLVIIHVVFARFVTLHDQYNVVLFIIASVATILIVSSASFRFFERPIMTILGSSLREFAKADRLGPAKIAAETR